MTVSNIQSPDELRNLRALIVAALDHVEELLASSQSEPEIVGRVRAILAGEQDDEVKIALLRDLLPEPPDEQPRWLDTGSGPGHSTDDTYDSRD